MLAAADQTSRRPERATVMVVFALIFQKFSLCIVGITCFTENLGRGFKPPRLDNSKHL